MNGHPVTTAYQPKPPVEQAAKMTESVKTIIGGVTTIHQSIEFVCSAQDLYETLTNPQRCMAWTRGTAQFNQDEFSYFGGNITGKWVEKVPCSKLVQQWRLKSWPKDHYSKVTMELKEGSESVTVTLTQTGVPIGEKDTVESNWAHYYWNSIKGVFGYGALL
jgi:activator of HSP90 ATPase